MSVTRRSVLGALLAASVVGCRPRRSSRSAVAPADKARIASAVAGEQALLARYDDAIAQLDAVAAGPLTRARDRHADHLRALTEAGPRPAPTASPSSAAPTVGPGAAGLNTDLAASAANLREAAVRVSAGRLAALLASIAAEHVADALAEGVAP